MRNFLFSALACVAFAGSGFASNESNEIVLENSEIDHAIMFSNIANHLEKESFLDRIFTKKDCKIEVRARDKNGNSTTKYAGGLGPITLLDCDNIRKRFEADLRADGYTFTDDDVTLHWGHID